MIMNDVHLSKFSTRSNFHEGYSFILPVHYIGEKVIVFKAVVNVDFFVVDCEGTTFYTPLLKEEFNIHP